MGTPGQTPNTNPNPVAVTWADGSTLTSTALTPDTFLALMQPIIANATQLDPNSGVRIQWPQKGAPAWTIDQDICFLRAELVDHPYSRVRDSIYTGSGDSFTAQMGFVQIWQLFCRFWGPNAATYARVAISAMTNDADTWAHDTLAKSNVYLAGFPSRPYYGKEPFGGQWWPRADVRMRFNELVTEYISVPPAQSIEVTVVTDAGLTVTVQASAD